ncbi:hydroxypyruvate isomerase family protein [Granulicoccus sp. GXG6511]|uniref:hydroxypyruvate isomerase family protein n=1 Tax=Granulicoccus sp. GXG6511 TaxID=3381351 RepID=UPI003D7CE1C9
MVPDANLAWLFTEVDWPDRFAAAAAAGFTGVEMPWPPVALDDVAARLEEHGLSSVLVNVPVGEPGSEWAFGWACRPDAVDRFRETFTTALAHAESTGTRFIHVLAGLCPPDLDHDLAYATYRENLVWALDQLHADGPTLVVEAINRRDQPLFLLSGLTEAARLVRSIANPRLRLLFDTFHCGVELLEAEKAGLRRTAIAEPSLGWSPTVATVASRFAEMRDIVGHIQVGDAPDRTDPGTGLIDFTAFFAALRDLEWVGFVGGEYRPTAGTLAGLGWREELTPHP